MELHVQLRHYIFIPNGRYSKNDFFLLLFLFGGEEKKKYKRHLSKLKGFKTWVKSMFGAYG